MKMPPVSFTETHRTSSRQWICQAVTALASPLMELNSTAGTELAIQIHTWWIQDSFSKGLTQDLDWLGRQAEPLGAEAHVLI